MLEGNRAEQAMVVEKSPLFRPQLVRHETLLPYLKQIDDSHWYSNYGPLVCSLEKRLTEYFDYPQGSAALVSSGTTAITSTLLALDLPKGSQCILPGWTFVGTEAGVRAAGLQPLCLDVNLDSWVLDIELVETELKKNSNIRAIIVVCPFAKMVDLAQWEALSDQYNIPVVIDGASCFDSFKMADYRSKLPFIISLHATKVFGIGEGGLVLSSDGELITRIKCISNFGILPDRTVKTVGINAKMSEYQAAVGHAMLDNWEDFRFIWQNLIQTVQAKLSPFCKTLSTNYISNSCVLQFDDVNVIKKLKAALQDVMEIRGIWHMLDQNCSNAMQLFQHTVSVPFYLGMDHKAICGAIRKVIDAR